MTDDSIALREFLEWSTDADPMREMIGFAAERPMELEVAGGAHSSDWQGVDRYLTPGRISFAS